MYVHYQVVQSNTSMLHSICSPNARLQRYLHGNANMISLSLYHRDSRINKTANETNSVYPETGRIKSDNILPEIVVAISHNMRAPCNLKASPTRAVFMSYGQHDQLLPREGQLIV